MLVTEGGYWIQRKDIGYGGGILVTEGGYWLQRGDIGYRGGILDKLRRYLV